MKRAAAILAALGLLLLLAAGVAAYAVRAAAKPPALVTRADIDEIDPAVLFHTEGQSPWFGGVDRWAVPGMDAARFSRFAKANGFTCALPQRALVGGAPKRGEALVSCRRTVEGRLARELRIDANFRWTHRRSSLLSATAESNWSTTLTPRWRDVGEQLRRWGWIEPATLEVTGLDLRQPTVLQRLLADTVSPTGWERQCTGTIGQACAQSARERAASGLPAAPVLASGDVEWMLILLETRGLVAPEAYGMLAAPTDDRPDPHGRGPDIPLGESDRATARPWIPVHWVDGLLEVRLEGRTLRGQTYRVVLTLQPDGGWVTGLAAGFDEVLQSFNVQPVPQPLPEDKRHWRIVPMRPGRHDAPLHGRWIQRPNESMDVPLPLTYRELHLLLPQVRGATMQWLLQALFDGDRAPILDAELYGLLNRAERVAARLKLPLGRALREAPGVDDQMRLQPPPDPVLRIGWLLAQCDRDGPPRVLDAACWQRHVNADVEIARLLAIELDQLIATHGDLPADHPINRRLRQLAAVHASR